MASKVASPGPDLQDHLRFDAVLADLSSRFVKLGPTEVDREFEKVQRRVCECLDLDPAAIWQMSREELGVLRMTVQDRAFMSPIWDTP